MNMSKAILAMSAFRYLSGRGLSHSVGGKLFPPLERSRSVEWGMGQSVFLLLCLLFSGCATKFRYPLNRMMTPETVGGNFNTEVEVGKQGVSEGKVDTSGSSPYPLKFSQGSATSYFAAMSFVDSVDFYWNYVVDSPGMFGAKWQFMGTSQQTGGTGHSMALTMGFGGNKHEIDGDTKIDMRVGAFDVAILHGFWFTSFWQVFDSLGVSRYNANGTLSGSTSGKVNDSARQVTLAVGSALVFRPVELKVEWAYSKVDWSDSGSKTYSSIALALGFSL